MTFDHFGRVNRNISTDITSYTINNANITDYKVNINNTLGSVKHDKKVEDYLNKACIFYKKNHFLLKNTKNISF